jgi:hypothetical protein|tara:strand:+ start:988 stop:1206 length:219 start_codon:yes stop_codon:yes gene_type:complete
MTELTTKKLKKMSKSQLNKLANELATRLQWQHSTGKDESDPESYKRLALELYHVSELIEEKIRNKVKNNYNK